MWGAMIDWLKKVMAPPSGLDRIIVETLQGKGHSEYSRLSEVARSPDGYLYQLDGGYHLIFPQRYNREAQAGDIKFVNLSTALYRDDLAQVIRSRILEISDKLRIPVIPISEVALTRIRDRWGAHPARLVERRGQEAVFSYHPSDGPVMYFLSGFDEQESPPLYFLCQLPRPVSSLDEAREALKPKSVVAAQKAGIEVRRQGDLFFIKSALTTEQIREAGGKIFPDPIIQEVVQLYGTAHHAERTAVLPDGRMLGSGRVRHNPALVGERRDPDHHTLHLDDGWWWVARNTVPITGTRQAPLFLPTKNTANTVSRYSIFSDNIIAFESPTFTFPWRIVTMASNDIRATFHGSGEDAPVVNLAQPLGTAEQSALDRRRALHREREEILRQLRDDITRRGRRS